MPEYPRRRLLRIGGAGTAAALAGCTSALDALEDDGVEPDDIEADAGDDLAVTVAADIDQAAMMDLQEAFGEDQQQLQEALEAGEIDEEEFQAEMEALQQEAEAAQTDLVADSVETIEAHVEDAEALTVAEAAVESGVLLVEGGAESLIGLLGLDDVAGLLADGEFDAITQGGPP